MRSVFLHLSAAPIMLSTCSKVNPDISTAPNAVNTPVNTLSVQEKSEGWILLFYGSATNGHIALQDHREQVWYRDIKIKKLKPVLT